MSSGRGLTRKSGFKPKKQKGVALISVLLAVALCVILATEILTAQKLQVQRTQNLLERQQAYWYAMGAEQFIKTLLQRTLKQDKGVVNLEQSWAMEGMTFPIDNGLIEGQVYDLHQCFNINSLYNPAWSEEKRKKHKEVFVRYLSSLDITSELSEEDLTNNIVDWLDPDNYPVEAVGYDGDMYSSMPFPYLSANSPLANESELRVIYGFDVLVMTQLQNKLCVIPNNSQFQINVNTLDNQEPELLAALLNIDSEKAKDILAERPEKGFEDLADFWALSSVKGLKNIADVDKSQFTVQSKFFKLVTSAHYNDMKFDLTSVLQMDEQNIAHVIARRFGGRIERKADPETE